MDQTAWHQSKKIFHAVDSYEKIKRFFDFENGKKLKILDVGCGPGLLGAHLRTLGHTVIGLDIYTANQSEDKNFINCDINLKWPVEDDSFDLVIATDVPEHVYDPAHILREAKRVLNSAGKLIFGVPNHFDLRQRIRTLLGKGIIHWDHVKFGENAWNYAHIRFFSLTELYTTFRANNWNVTTSQFNFMGCGIIPTRFTPNFIRLFLLKSWPNLFSGKFIFLLSKETDLPNNPFIYITKTPKGL